MKENIPCKACNKERMIDTSKWSIKRYLKRSPKCRKCATKNPALRKKISKGWFPKGLIPWSATHKMPPAWNKGLKGTHFSPSTEFKYKNGNGYRHLLIRGELKQKCKKCPETNLKRLHVHHKDENRKNNSKKNLMVLCRPCHLLEHGRKERVYVEGRKAV